MAVGGAKEQRRGLIRPVQNLTRSVLAPPRCWDDTDVSFIWWIIRVPITASLLVSPEPESGGAPPPRRDCFTSL